MKAPLPQIHKVRVVRVKVVKDAKAKLKFAQVKVVKDTDEEQEKNSETAQAQLNSQQLIKDTLMTNLDDAHQCYKAWKERCEQVEERVTDDLRRLLQNVSAFESTHPLGA